MATILLLDPDPDTARRNADTLVRAGFRVAIGASDPQTAVPPSDVIILSVPKLEHAAVGDVERREVPHILISSDPADARRAPEFGCAAVLIRPVMYDELVKAVRCILSGVPSVAG